MVLITLIGMTFVAQKPEQIPGLFVVPSINRTGLSA